MGLQLKEIYDPRDPLRKIRRKPLENYMRRSFPQLYKHNMPADLMRMLLREQGVYDIPELPKQTLAQTNVRIDSTPRVQNTTPPPPPAPAEEIDHMALLKREFESVDYSKMDYRYLQKLCKVRGIKMVRTDKFNDLVDKLNGKDASSGNQ